MKKIIVNAIYSMVISIGISACGSTSESGGSSNGISDREHVAIIYHYPTKACTETYFQATGVSDIIVSIESNDVSCANYGKKDDGEACHTSDFLKEEYTHSCVAGFNGKPNYKRKQENVLESMWESLIYKLESL